MTTTPQDALKNITTGDMGEGGTLPREMQEEFFTEVQDESVVLDRVRVHPVNRQKTRIPKIGVGERLRRGQDEGESQDESGVDTGWIDIDTEKASIYWSLTRETVEENPEREQLADTIMSLMAQQWAVDTEDLGFVGDEEETEADDADFISQNDGWIKILEDRSAPVYDHGDGGIDTTLFHETVQTVGPKYLRADPVFIMNIQQLQEYAHALTEREDGLGATVLMGDSDLTPFNYDIVGSAMVPEDTAIFTPPQNLIYAPRYDLRVEVLQQSDEVFDNDLYAKYKIVGKDDFEVEDENGAVLVENIGAISA